MRFRTQRGTEQSDHTNWPIHDVLEHYGWDGQERGGRTWSKIRCPWHVDRNPSAGVSEDLNSFRCMSCDRGGNSVTLVMAEENLSAREAVEWLESRIGSGPTSDSATADRQRTSRQPRIPWEPMTLR